MTPDSVAEAIAGLRVANERMFATIHAMTEADARGPSLLPAWTRAHVLAHLTLNAQSQVRMLRDGLPQYPGGPAARAADIEELSIRPVAELVTAVDRSAADLDTQYADEPDRWDRPLEFMAGPFPASRSPRSRRREVEVHHVDLALHYGPVDWPHAFVATELPDALATLDARLPAGARVRVVVEDDDVDFVCGHEREPLVTVEGPGFAVLAWLLGRPIPVHTLRASEAGGHTRVPEIGPWS